MPILATVNGKAPGRDRLLASVGVRRFPSPVVITNTGEVSVEVELRVRDGAGARITLAERRWTVSPGCAVETTIQADSPSQAPDDTVLEVMVGGAVESEFRFTAVSLARESVFHNLVPKI